MIRPDAIMYLNGRYGTLMEALHIRPEDTPAGLGPSIDGAWLELGLARTDETSPSQDRQTFALLRAHFLTHALERAAVFVDIAADDPSVQAKRSQMFTQIQSALKIAQGDAEIALQDADPDAGQMESFRFNLDWTQDMPVGV